MIGLLGEAICHYRPPTHKLECGVRQESLTPARNGWLQWDLGLVNYNRVKKYVWGYEVVKKIVRYISCYLLHPCHRCVSCCWLVAISLFHMCSRPHRPPHSNLAFEEVKLLDCNQPVHLPDSSSCLVHFIMLLKWSGHSPLSHPSCASLLLSFDDHGSSYSLWVYGIF